MNENAILLPKEILRKIMFHRFTMMIIYDIKKAVPKITIKSSEHHMTFSYEEDWETKQRYNCEINQIMIKSLKLWHGKAFLFSCICKECKEFLKLNDY